MIGVALERCVYAEQEVPQIYSGISEDDPCSARIARTMLHLDALGPEAPDVVPVVMVMNLEDEGEALTGMVG